MLANHSSKIRKALVSKSIRNVVSPTIPPFQVRNINILQSTAQKLKLEQLKKLMEKSPSDSTTFAYLQQIALITPQSAAQLIAKGWNEQKLPLNEQYLQLYLKTVGSMNRLDSINIAQLLQLVNKSKNGNGTGTSTSSINNQLDMVALAKATAGTSSSAFSAGSSPNQPLFVKQSSASWPEAFKSVAKFGIGLFILTSIFGTFFSDEKGGAASGIAGRLGGMSSIVKQAERSDKTFNDVVGIDEAKGDLQEIVMYLKDPKRFTRLGGRLPKGVLLTGPPGTGKTLLARAIAGEAGVPFFHTSGSEFEEMYVGVGAKRVRELFEAAKAKSPCIIFIDEIDAIGGSRTTKDASAMKMTLNQLLVEMDGFQQNTGIIVIAATNFPDSLDSALIRPGRLDKHVDVTLPDIGGRQAILELYGKKVPLDADVSMEQLARGTPGFSGAELFNLINTAALKASVDGLKSVGMGALEYAKDKIMMGAERKSAVISPETMRTTAFHEAGHALVAIKTEGSDPVHKATIMPRGRSLGMVMQLPDGDQTSMTRKQMLARLDICMGGRVAEELVYGEENVTSGASSDIQQATNLAKAMVTRYGFNTNVGVMFIDEKAKHSGETQAFIDNEVRELLKQSYLRAKTLIEGHRRELDLIAQGLMEHESLSGHEIVEISQGRSPDLAKRSQKPSRAMQVLPVPKVVVNPAITPVTVVPPAVKPVVKPVAKPEAKVSPVAAVSTPDVAKQSTPAPSSSGSIFSSFMSGSKQSAAPTVTTKPPVTPLTPPPPSNTATVVKDNNKNTNKPLTTGPPPAPAVTDSNSAPAPSSSRGPPKA